MGEMSSLERIRNRYSKGELAFDSADVLDLFVIINVLQSQVLDADARAEKAEAMVERLIMAGEPRKSTTDKQPPSMWINLVEEWNQSKKAEAE